MFTYLVCDLPQRKELPARFYTYDGVETLVHDELASALPIDKTVVSFDLGNIVGHLTGQGRRPEIQILDISQLAKQAAGQRLGPDDLDGEPSWSLWSLLRSTGMMDDAACRRASDVYHGIERHVDHIDRAEVFKQLVARLADLGSSTIASLHGRSEWDRFEQVEMPIQTLCFQRSLKGIGVDRSGLASRVAELHRRIYRYRNCLQLNYRIFSARDQRGIRTALKDAGLSGLIHFVGQPKFERFIKDLSGQHELLSILHEERKASREKDALLRLDVGEPGVFYPLFDSMGTVTGRILVRDPAVQSLSRKNRSVITPTHGHELLYVDYARFEAAILADECQDPLLIEHINEGDVYARLSERIFENREEREFCKRLFFRYCYGASDDGLGAMFLGRPRADALAANATAAFGGYPKLVAFRERMSDELLRDGKVGTRSGNYRYLDRDEITNPVPPPWGLSQRIQGTASLILKRAILRCASLHPLAQFLLPMHDAALFQVPIGRTAEFGAELCTTFETVLKEECPTIRAEAKLKIFAD